MRRKFLHNAGALRSGVTLQQGFLCEAGLGAAAVLLFLLSLGEAPVCDSEVW